MPVAALAEEANVDAARSALRCVAHAGNGDEGAVAAGASHQGDEPLLIAGDRRGVAGGQHVAAVRERSAMACQASRQGSAPPPGACPGPASRMGTTTIGRGGGASVADPAVWGVAAGGVAPAAASSRLTRLALNR